MANHTGEKPSMAPLIYAFALSQGSLAFSEYLNHKPYFWHYLTKKIEAALDTKT